MRENYANWILQWAIFWLLFYLKQITYICLHTNKIPMNWGDVWSNKNKEHILTLKWSIQLIQRETNIYQFIKLSGIIEREKKIIHKWKKVSKIINESWYPYSIEFNTFRSIFSLQIKRTGQINLLFRLVVILMAAMTRISHSFVL